MMDISATGPKELMEYMFCVCVIMKQLVLLVSSKVLHCTG